MFNYPATLEYVTANRARLLKYEQRCTACRQWYEVPLGDLIADLEYVPPPGQFGKPFRSCVCTCGHSAFLILPGKYDSHRSKRPTMQRCTFARKS